MLDKSPGSQHGSRPTALALAGCAVLATLCATTLLIFPGRSVGGACHLAGACPTCEQLLPQRSQDATHLQCLKAATDGDWEELGSEGCESPLPGDVAFCEKAWDWERFDHKWVWGDPDAASSCGLRKWSHEAMHKWLSNRTLVFAGDSHLRYMQNYLSIILGGKEVRKEHGHPEDSVQLIESSNTTVIFSWKPLVSDIKQFLSQWKRKSRGTSADILLVDAGVWHLALNEKDKRNMTSMRKQASRLLETVTELQKDLLQDMLLIWVYGPSRHPATQVNRTDIPFEYILPYNKVAQRAGLLQPSGPFHLVDLYSLTQGCLHWCMLEDGAHARNAVNEVALQWIFNIWELEERMRQQGKSPQGAAAAAAAAAAANEVVAHAEEGMQLPEATGTET